MAKYSSPSIGIIHVPQFLTAPGSDLAQGATPVARRPRAELAEVVAAYDSDAAPELHTYGTASRYRQIRPPEWPSRGRVHYEFIQSRDTIGVDLHLEDTTAARLAPKLQLFAGSKVAPLGSLLEWDPTWNKNRGRLTVRLPSSTPAKSVADTMVALIRLTRDTVGTELAART